MRCAESRLSVGNPKGPQNFDHWTEEGPNAQNGLQEESLGASLRLRARSLGARDKFRSEQNATRVASVVGIDRYRPHKPSRRTTDRKQSPASVLNPKPYSD